MLPHMPAITTHTEKLTADQAARLRLLLAERGFEFMEKPYCLYAASKPGLAVLVYEKGPKVVVQGKGTAGFITDLLEPEILGEAKLGYEEILQPEMYQPHIGVDESGKGDFFGPLVIAGVFVDGDVARRLREIGAVTVIEGWLRVVSAIVFDSSPIVACSHPNIHIIHGRTIRVFN
jgi:ribonuclease HIII